MDYLESLLNSGIKLASILRQYLYGEEEEELYVEDILKLAGIKEKPK